MIDVTCWFNIQHKIHFVKIGLFIKQSVEAVNGFFPTALVLPKFDCIGRLWFNLPCNLITFPIFQCLKYFTNRRTNETNSYSKRSVFASDLVMFSAPLKNKKYSQFPKDNKYAWWSKEIWPPGRGNAGWLS